jgi:hypothetical protein
MTKWLLVLLALFAISASAADITGTWKGSMESQQGAMDVTFTFKVAGTALTGSVSNPMGPDANPISEGKIDGDALSFVVAVDMMGNAMKINYKGKVISATEMTLTMSFPGMGGGDPMTMEIKAKKAN